MAKFIMECPNCGRYVEAKTGFFAKKKIDCTCGYTIKVKTDKMTSRSCPHCGNDVVFDQSKGADAKCPVCKNPINTMMEQDKHAEFTCEQCGVRLRTAKTASTYTCPVCDFVNDVPERLKREEIRKEGMASVIKYEGDNETFVWKHPVEDFNMGSQLIVHESQEAVFYRNGAALDLFGPGRYTLETQQLPILEKFYQLPSDTTATFHSEVYFVNLTTQMGIKWGTDSKVRLFDPGSGMYLELGASGEFNIRVIDSRKVLLKLVGTSGGMGQNALLGGAATKGMFRSLVMTQVKTYLAQTIKEQQINVLELDEHLLRLSEALRVRINETLVDYGLEMPEFFVSRIVTPDDDPNFRKMKEQYAAKYLLIKEEEIKKAEAEAAFARKTVEAQTAAQMKIIGAQGSAEALRIQKQAEADAYRMQAEAEAMEMKMKGYTYREETARQVGLEAMQNGLTGHEGGGGGGLNSGFLGDIAGLGMTLGAVGTVVGMTKDAMAPVMDSLSPNPMVPDGWVCSCGASNITSKFCPECGKPKPAPKAAGDTWSCPACGAKDISSKFCPECGMKKPEKQTWNCPSCGAKEITTKFCPECGSKKPEKATWDCPNCGNKDITAKFCPECGTKRGV